ncbi:hypothetical protein [Anaerosinus massiliensis]|uniref:hypothetical protein n=1 Tax=Massilibacillus massiliensis TaxID=1806837 RepID=UPI000DA604CF|nr:hypothetical protein [Massilibacillus massiliensis]
MSMIVNEGYYLTVYIAVRGCPMIKENGEPDDPSEVGHMWISVDHPSGLKESYGFHPKISGQMHTDVGKVKDSDLHAYQEINYQRSFPLGESMYKNLRNYCQLALEKNTFGPYWGVGNACVDFAWDVMHAAGIDKPFIAKITPIEDWPAYNKGLVEMAYYSYMMQVEYEGYRINDAEVWMG